MPWPFWVENISISYKYFFYLSVSAGLMLWPFWSTLALGSPCYNPVLPRVPLRSPLPMPFIKYLPQWEYSSHSAAHLSSLDIFDVLGFWNPARLKHKMGLIKRRRVYEHAQNAQIHAILHMRKVSSGHLLSSEIVYSIQLFSLQTSKTLIRLCGCAGWSGPSLSIYARRHVFAWCNQKRSSVVSIFP